MNKIIDTNVISGSKSTFVIDLVKSTEGNLFIELHQSINKTKEKVALSKINPEVLSSIIAQLQEYHAIINIAQPIKHLHVDHSKSQKIIDYYFKSVNIGDIALLLNLKEKVIEQVLKSNGIVIYQKKIPKRRF